MSDSRHALHRFNAVYIDLTPPAVKGAHTVLQHASSRGLEPFQILVKTTNGEFELTFEQLLTLAEEKGVKI